MKIENLDRAVKLKERLDEFNRIKKCLEDSKAHENLILGYLDENSEEGTVTMGGTFTKTLTTELLAKLAILEDNIKAEIKDL